MVESRPGERESERPGLLDDLIDLIPPWLPKLHRDNFIIFVVLDVPGINQESRTGRRLLDRMDAQSLFCMEPRLPEPTPSFLLSHSAILPSFMVAVDRHCTARRNRLSHSRSAACGCFCRLANSIKGSRIHAAYRRVLHASSPVSPTTHHPGFLAAALLYCTALTRYD